MKGLLGTTDFARDNRASSALEFKLHHFAVKKVKIDYELFWDEASPRNTSLEQIRRTSYTSKVGKSSDKVLKVFNVVFGFWKLLVETPDAERPRSQFRTTQISKICSDRSHCQSHWCQLVDASCLSCFYFRPRGLQSA